MRFEREEARVRLDDFFRIRKNRFLERFDLIQSNIQANSASQRSVWISYGTNGVENALETLIPYSEIGRASTLPLSMSTDWFRRSQVLLFFCFSMLSAIVYAINVLDSLMTTRDMFIVVLGSIFALFMFFCMAVCLVSSFLHVGFDGYCLSVRYLFRKDNIGINEIKKASIEVSERGNERYRFQLIVEKRNGKKVCFLEDTRVNVLILWNAIDRALQEQWSRTKKLSDRNSI